MARCGARLERQLELGNARTAAPNTQLLAERTEQGLITVHDLRHDCTPPSACAGGADRARPDSAAPPERELPRLRACAAAVDRAVARARAVGAWRAYIR